MRNALDKTAEGINHSYFNKVLFMKQCENTAVIAAFPI
jgi:hypothetical protein